MCPKDKRGAVINETGEGKIFIIVFSLMEPGEGSLRSDEPLSCRALPAVGPHARHNSCHRHPTASPERPPCIPFGGTESMADSTFWKHRILRLIARALG